MPLDRLGVDDAEAGLVGGQGLEAGFRDADGVFEVKGAPTEFEVGHVDVDDHVFFEREVELTAGIDVIAQRQRVVGVFEAEAVRRDVEVFGEPAFLNHLDRL